MNSFTINREAVPPALPRTGSWHVLLAVGVVLTGCGARGLQSTGGDAAQAGGAGAGGALSSGGISGAGGALSSAGASAGGTLSSAGASAGGALSRGGASAGGALSSGTAGLGGTRDIIPSTGRGTGGVTAQAGAADSGVAAQGGSDGGGQDSVCDMAALQFALQDAAIPSGLGMCIMDTDPSLSSTLGQPWGVIIIDGDGRLVVATGPAQKLVYTLADQRWTCVAGSTFLYWCSIAA
jgi:hypothetical protein